MGGKPGELQQRSEASVGTGLIPQDDQPEGNGIHRNLSQQENPVRTDIRLEEQIQQKEDITELQKQAKEKWRDISNQYLEDRGLHELKKSEPSEKNSGKIYRCSEVWHWETPQYVVELRSFFTYNEKDVNPRLISGNINLVLAMGAAAILTSHQAGTKENTPSSTRERRDNAKSSFTPIPLEQKKVKKIKKVIIR